MGFFLFLSLVVLPSCSFSLVLSLKVYRLVGVCVCVAFQPLSSPIVAVTVKKCFGLNVTYVSLFPGIQRLRVRDLSSPSVNFVTRQSRITTNSQHAIVFLQMTGREMKFTFLDFVDLYFFKKNQRRGRYISDGGGRKERRNERIIKVDTNERRCTS
jgi:hypothetical protein